MLRKAGVQANQSVRGPEAGLGTLHQVSLAGCKSSMRVRPIICRHNADAWEFPVLQVEDQSHLYQRAPIAMRDAGLGDQTAHAGLPHGMSSLSLAALSTAAAAVQVASMPQSAPMGAVDTSGNFFNQVRIQLALIDVM